MNIKSSLQRIISVVATILFFVFSFVACSDQMTDFERFQEAHSITFSTSETVAILKLLCNDELESEGILVSDSFLEYSSVTEVKYHVLTQDDHYKIFELAIPEAVAYALSLDSPDQTDYFLLQEGYDLWNNSSVKLTEDNTIIISCRRQQLLF